MDKKGSACIQILKHEIRGKKLEIYIQIIRNKEL